MAVIHGQWEQVSLIKQADVRRLALMGSPEAATAWAAIAARDPHGARLAAAWDERRAAQQAEVNAVADMITKAADYITKDRPAAKVRCTGCAKKIRPAGGQCPKCFKVIGGGKMPRRNKGKTVRKMYGGTPSRGSASGGGIGRLQRQWAEENVQAVADHQGQAAADALRQAMRERSR